MERLREHMEAAIRERWPERPLTEQPAERERPRRQCADPQRPVRRLGAPIKVWAPAIRVVPVHEETLARNHIVTALPESPERDAYRDLQRAVLRRIDEDGLRVIGVTSPSVGSGTTLTSVNLAVSLAVNAHRPVMIIDLDLGAPAVHGLFGVDLKAGLEDHLLGSVSVADVLFSPSIEGVSVLPARGTAGAANEAIGSRRLVGLLETVKRVHPEKILVVDLPSLEDESDGQAFEALVDGLLLVVEDDVTEERDYRRALQSVGRRKLIGTVLNRVPSV